jgi:hypothetical protein
MAITDNAFTSEEFKASVEANPALLEQVTGYLKGQEYSVFNKTDYDAHKTVLAREAASDYEKTLSTELETYVSETSKTPKKDGESFKDYTKRVLLEKSQSSENLAAEIAELKSKTDLSKAERDQLAELTRIRDEQKTEIENLKANSQKEVLQLKAQNDISVAATKVASKFVKEALVQDAISIVSEKTIAEMVASSQYENGKLVFIKDGKVEMNQDGSFKTAEQKYESLMEKFIDKGRKAGGAGGDGGEGTTKTPADVNTKYKLGKYLNSLGLVSGTIDFTEKFNALGGKSMPDQ